METSPRENYLLTEVMTATPQKLQLMLIEAAIRSTELAREKRRAGEEHRAGEALIHAQEVVGELLAGLNRDADPGLARKMASVYLFVFRCLTEASRRHDEKKLQDALRVLEVERETWRQVCRQFGTHKTPDRQTAAAETSENPEQSGGQRAAASQGPPAPHLSPESGAIDAPASPGISLEA